VDVICDLIIFINVELVASSWVVTTHIVVGSLTNILAISFLIIGFNDLSLEYSELKSPILNDINLIVIPSNLYCRQLDIYNNLRIKNKIYYISY
jgi:hypothetical protein